MLNRLPLLREMHKPESLMQVGDLAHESGRTVRAIHLYEELGLLIPAARSKGHYRLYDPDALTRVRWIGKLQEMGFSLGDIQIIVRDWAQASSAPDAMTKVREMYRRKLAQTRAALVRMRALEHELDASLSYLDTCEVCDPERLISACPSCDQRHDCTPEVPELVAGLHATGPRATLEH